MNPRLRRFATSKGNESFTVAGLGVQCERRSGLWSCLVQILVSAASGAVAGAVKVGKEPPTQVYRGPPICLTVPQEAVAKASLVSLLAANTTYQSEACLCVHGGALFWLRIPSSDFFKRVLMKDRRMINVIPLVPPSANLRRVHINHDGVPVVEDLNGDWYAPWISELDDYRMTVELRPAGKERPYIFNIDHVKYPTYNYVEVQVERGSHEISQVILTVHFQPELQKQLKEEWEYVEKVVNAGVIQEDDALRTPRTTLAEEESNDGELASGSSQGGGTQKSKKVRKKFPELPKGDFADKPVKLVRLVDDRGNEEIVAQIRMKQEYLLQLQDVYQEGKGIQLHFRDGRRETLHPAYSADIEKPSLRTLKQCVRPVQASFFGVGWNRSYQPKPGAPAQLGFNLHWHFPGFFWLNQLLLGHRKFRPVPTHLPHRFAPKREVVIEFASRLADATGLKQRGKDMGWPENKKTVYVKPKACGGEKDPRWAAFERNQKMNSVLDRVVLSASRATQADYMYKATSALKSKRVAKLMEGNTDRPLTSEEVLARTMKQMELMPVGATVSLNLGRHFFHNLGLATNNLFWNDALPAYFGYILLRDHERSIRLTKTKANLDADDAIALKLSDTIGRMLLLCVTTTQNPEQKLQVDQTEFGHVKVLIAEASLVFIWRCDETGEVVLVGSADRIAKLLAFFNEAVKTSNLKHLHRRLKAFVPFRDGRPAKPTEKTEYTHDEVETYQPGGPTDATGDQPVAQIGNDQPSSMSQQQQLGANKSSGVDPWTSSVLPPSRPKTVKHVGGAVDGEAAGRAAADMAVNSDLPDTPAASIKADVDFLWDITNTEAFRLAKTTTVKFELGLRCMECRLQYACCPGPFFVAAPRVSQGYHWAVDLWGYYKTRLQQHHGQNLTLAEETRRESGKVRLMAISERLVLAVFVVDSNLCYPTLPAPICCTPLGSWQVEAGEKQVKRATLYTVRKEDLNKATKDLQRVQKEAPNLSSMQMDVIPMIQGLYDDSDEPGEKLVPVIKDDDGVARLCTPMLLKRLEENPELLSPFAADYQPRDGNADSQQKSSNSSEDSTVDTTSSQSVTEQTTPSAGRSQCAKRSRTPHSSGVCTIVTTNAGDSEQTTLSRSVSTGSTIFQSSVSKAADSLTVSGQSSSFRSPGSCHKRKLVQRAVSSACLTDVQRPRRIPEEQDVPGETQARVSVLPKGEAAPQQSRTAAPRVQPASLPSTVQTQGGVAATEEALVPSQEPYKLPLFITGQRLLGVADALVQMDPRTGPLLEAVRNYVNDPNNTSRKVTISLNPRGKIGRVPLSGSHWGLARTFFATAQKTFSKYLGVPRYPYITPEADFCHRRAASLDDVITYTYKGREIRRITELSSEIVGERILPEPKAKYANVYNPMHRRWVTLRGALQQWCLAELFKNEAMESRWRYNADWETDKRKFLALVHNTEKELEPSMSRRTLKNAANALMKQTMMNLKSVRVHRQVKNLEERAAFDMFLLALRSVAKVEVDIPLCDITIKAEDKYDVKMHRPWDALILLSYIPDDNNDVAKDIRFGPDSGPLPRLASKK